MKSFIIIVNNKRYSVEIDDVSNSPVTVVVNGETFEVEIEDKPSQASPEMMEMAISVAPPDRKQETIPVTQKTVQPAAVPGKVIAPMPGKIVAIKVNVGDRVSPGDELCILEAMKMENSIRASQAGVVKQIRVAVGQSVAYGDVLIELEQEK